MASKEGRLMPTGRVKSYSVDTGYGFIIPDDGGRDVFVHARAVEAAGLWFLTEGQRLGYNLLDRKPASKGQSAHRLREIA